jgi:RNA polymerase sigma-70 factor (ECF subfamily)
MAKSDPPERPASGRRANPRPQTSLTLLERLRAKERDAWQIMVELYRPLVHYWCTRAGVRGADLEDVAQEVFRAASTSLDSFRRDQPGDSFRGWLRGITRNMLLRHFQRSARQPRAAGGTDALRKLQEIEAGGPGTEAVDDDNPVGELDGLRRRALELVRAEFEERTWQMFWLTVVEGRSPVDIAAEKGVSPAAVRMAKSRILHRLKEEFGEPIQ